MVVLTAIRVILSKVLIVLTKLHNVLTRLETRTEESGVVECKNNMQPPSCLKNESETNTVQIYSDILVLIWGKLSVTPIVFE